MAGQRTIVRLCSGCGRRLRIALGPKRGEYEGGHYFGLLDVNACRTSKYHYRLGKNWPEEKAVKIPNTSYDQKVKPAYVELWECDRCFREPSTDKKMARKRGNVGKGRRTETERG